MAEDGPIPLADAAPAGSAPPKPPRRHHWWDGYMAPLSDEERRRAIEEPGPSWTEFLLFSYLKWLLGMGFLIADSTILLTFLLPLDPFALAVTFALALYLEYLLWQYLWHRPPLQEGRRFVDPDFRSSWHHPVAYGRWTPEAKAVREGADLSPRRGPDPRDFL